MAHPGLSATAKLLLAVLQDHRNARTGQCNPKRKTLALEMGVSISTIRRTLDDLREAGLVRSKRASRTSRYEILKGQNDPSREVKLTLLERSNPPFTGDVSLYEPIEDEPNAACPTVEGFRDAPEDAAAPSPKPPALAVASTASGEATFATVRESLQGLAQAARIPPPDDDLVRRVIAAAPDATGEEISATLVRLWKSGCLAQMRGWGLVLVKLGDCVRQGAA
jgi:DNA-binding transcriptional ArsR family regulator